MPTPKIIERWDSRSGTEGNDAGSQDWVYVVAYADNEAEAVALVAGAAPLTAVLPLGKTITRQGFSWEIDEGDLVVVTVKYNESTPPDEFDFSFDTTGKTEKITQAIRNVANYAASGTAPDFKGAIGVSKDGVEGCEIPTRSFKWTETHEVPLELLAFTGYAQVLEAVTGTKNAGGFRGRAARSCIFLGAQGGKKSADKGQVTYHFESGKHITGLSSGQITGIAKQAWDYLWYRFEEKEDAAAKALVKRATSAHVDEVIPEADWSVLGIGN